MRVRIANTLGNRDETTAKDERLLNCFAEVESKSVVHTVKRPGLVSQYTLGVGVASATVGQLLFAWSTPSAPGISGTATIIGIRGDRLTRPVS